MPDASNDTPLYDIYSAALPDIRGRPLRTMPATLYGYIFKTSARQQTVLALLTLLVFPLTLAPLELQRRIIDGAIAGRDEQQLLSLVAIYLAVVTVHAGLKFVRNLYATGIAEGIARLLRRRVATTDAFDRKADDGTRQSILTTEAEKIGGFVSEGIAFPLLQGGIIVSVSGYMLVVDPLVALVALVFFIPALLVVGLTQPLLNRLSERKITETRALGETVLNQQQDRVNNPDKAADSDPDKHIDTIFGLRTRFAAVKFAAKGFTNVINHLGPLSVLAVGGWFAIQGQTEVGTIVAFMSGYERMTGPVRDLLNFYRRQAMMRVQYRLVYRAGRIVNGKAGASR